MSVAITNRVRELNHIDCVRLILEHLDSANNDVMNAKSPGQKLKALDKVRDAEHQLAVNAHHVRAIIREVERVDIAIRRIADVIV